MIEQNILNKIPAYWNEKDIYNTILTNDDDSLITASALKYLLNWDINYFYSFDGLYVLDESDQRESVGVDLALCKGKTICNHVMLQDWHTPRNNEAINMNSLQGITNDKYYKKYPLSSFLLVVALHNIELDFENDLLIKYILSIDSAYKGFYAKNQDFKKVYTDWLEVLGLEKFIYTLENTSMSFFTEQMKPLLDAKGRQITINGNGFLEFGDRNYEKISKQIGFDIKLPEGEFKKVMSFSNDEFTAGRTSADFMYDKNVYSYAFTYKNQGKVSRIITDLA